MALDHGYTTTMGEQEPVLPSERQLAGGLLPRVLTSFDMVAIFVAIVLFITNAPVVAGAGAAAFVYWLLGFLTFLLPGALVTGQLGLMFPGEGSLYLWTTKAFGPFVGFVAGFCAWWPGVLALIVTGDAVVALVQQLGALFGGSILGAPWQQGLLILAVIACSFGLSILRLRVTQNLVNAIFVAYGAAILLMGLAGLLWLLGGHAPQADVSLRGWSLNGNNATFYGTVILALLGIEVPLNMGVEVRDHRAITRYLLWGALVVMLAYLLGTFGVLMVVPAADRGNPTAVVEAVQRGFGPAGTLLGALVDLLLVGFFLFNTTVYTYSFARLLFVSGLDRRLPAAISRLNHLRVPWVAVLVQSAIAACFTVIIFLLAPLLAATSEPAALSTSVYDVLQAAVTVIWCVSMVMLFIDVILMRVRYRQRFERVQLAPLWLLVLCALLGCLASACGIAVTLSQPWTPLLSPATWSGWLLGIALVSLAAGAGVYLLGAFVQKRGAQAALLHSQQEEDTGAV